MWTGEKHRGKTTSAANLVKIARHEGFIVAGLLAPSIYNNDELHGFDVIDLNSEARFPLARRKTGRFKFFAEGLEFGNAALGAAATKSADLVIFDEFGPLELNGQGWRIKVDSLLTSSNALILLVVRQELADEVRQIYTDFPSLILPAIEPESIDKVIGMLKECRQLQRETV
ncbi:MAG: DUF2478 domain-containing protein [Sedimentisphaerales bacterium]|nr:DUF2478 domain-containing protein [Sedimentisphaerales bacterium]